MKGLRVVMLGAASAAATAVTTILWLVRKCRAAALGWRDLRMRRLRSLMLSAATVCDRWLRAVGLAGDLRYGDKQLAASLSRLGSRGAVWRLG